MKKKQAINFVCVHGQFQENAPDSSKYFVRFPKPFSTKVIFAPDTESLAEKLFRFSLTKEGKELWNILDKETQESYNKYQSSDEEGDEE